MSSSQDHAQPVTDGQGALPLPTPSIRAERWGDISDHNAPPQWLPIVNGMRLAVDGAPAFFPSRDEALCEARRVAALITGNGG